jgi:hypothetical protein
MAEIISSTPTSNCCPKEQKLADKQLQYQTVVIRSKNWQKNNAMNNSNTKLLL